MKLILSLAIFLSSMFFMGCTTPGVTIKEAQGSMGEIKQAIVGMVGELREVRDDQRQFTSIYFGRKAEKKFDSSRASERYFARFTIVSDRRPYDVLVEVIREARTASGFKSTGLDQTLSNQYARDLEKRLNQNKGGKSLIDDFRSF